ncbi:TcaA NTF2-like domain-containing protein [Paenibacillus faecis]
MFGEMFVDALSSNDFSLIEKYLIKDSEFYKEQKQFVCDN